MNQLTRPEYRATLRPVVRCIVKVALGLAFVAMAVGAHQAEFNRTHAEASGNLTTIGAVGYAEGTAQPRTLTIEDGIGNGQGHELARFEPTGNMTINGAIHVNGECGVWTLDANTRSGWLFIPKAGRCQ